MNQNAICHLCGKHAKLIKKSHIIPNLMYKEMFDDKNRMMMANLKDITVHPQLKQSGFYDKYILCSKM